MNQGYLICWLLASAAMAQDARQIMQESEKRGQVKSQKYEGVLQVFESNGRMREKRWVYERNRIVRKQQGHVALYRAS